jgi:hypothetical protein
MFSSVLRPIFFYPLAALVATGTILASMGTALIPHEPAAQAGASAGGTYVFGADSLQHVQVGAAQEYYLQRTAAGAPGSIQIATKKTYGAPGASDPGLRLMLTPQAAASLAGKPLRVDLQVRPLLYTTAPRLAVSAQSQGAPTQWVSEPFPSTAIERFSNDPTKSAAWISFALPAQAGPVNAIGLWPEADLSGGQPTLNYGVEILQLRIAPAGGG